MKKPVLIILAAGMGSRYGGLKQIAAVDEEGHSIIDYSMYDAGRAGFERVVCVVTPELERDFRKAVGDRAARRMDIRYAHQRLDALPAGFVAPRDRVKPWGTAHAVLSAKELVDGPFAVINADDYYGAEAFRSIYSFLAGEADATHHAMVGYRIGNTLTEHGHVARGVCRTDGSGNLVEVIERTHIEARPEGAAFTEDGERFTILPPDTVVSMNLWGFGQSMMGEIESRFGAYLAEQLPANPLKCEYFLPLVVNGLLKEGKAGVKVLPTGERWYGVTYAADMPVVRQAIGEMKARGDYPARLWED